MQDRLKKLFEEIKLEETALEYFDLASIEKVILYDQNKIIEFLIKTKMQNLKERQQKKS